MDYRLGESRYAGPRGWQSAEVLVGSVRCTAPGLQPGDRRGRVGLPAARQGGDFCAVCALRMIAAQKEIDW